MNIAIPMEGRICAVIHTTFVVSKRLTKDRYSLTGDSFNMTDVAAGQVLILPDDIPVTEGQIVTPEMQMSALPLESFISVAAEDALPNAIGLLLRVAVADGKLTDAEILSIQPTLEGRLWQPGIAVAVGDVYTFGPYLWRCIQAHITQSDWPPDTTPALWHKVEVVPEGEPRVWDTGIEYAVQDVVAYPDVNGQQYECLQAHTSQAGWEPPNAPALWQPHHAS